MIRDWGHSRCLTPWPLTADKAKGFCIIVSGTWINRQIIIWQLWSPLICNQTGGAQCPESKLPSMGAKTSGEGFEKIIEQAIAN